MSECPNCGQRLRSGWIRCPRCRLLLSEAQVEAQAPATAGGPPAWVWIAGGVAVVAVVALVVAWQGSTPALPSAEQQRAARQSGTLRTLDHVPPPINPPSESDSARRSQFESLDAKRSGAAAYAQGDLTGALSQYEAAVAATPNDPDARNSLAQVLIRQKRAAEAMPHLDEAVRLAPERWTFRFNRARAYDQLNRLTEAAAEYQVAAKLFPEDYATQYNLGLTLMRQKKYKESAAALERAVALAPGEPSFLITLGTAYVGAEQPDRAKVVFQQFLDLAPDDPEVPRVKALIGALNAASQPG